MAADQNKDVVRRFGASGVQEGRGQSSDPCRPGHELALRKDLAGRKPGRGQDLNLRPPGSEPVPSHLDMHPVPLDPENPP
jgi:hypothetical protein